MAGSEHQRGGPAGAGWEHFRRSRRSQQDTAAKLYELLLLRGINTMTPPVKARAGRTTQALASLQLPVKPLSAKVGIFSLDIISI